MPENIRLVIWDLDETLWRGTLTEGGIQEHSRSHYDTVRRLARRGIVSSICSKNDFDACRDILIEQGLWDYFVFPSIDWSPKGARLKAIVEAFQLRPETVLFIDDNPSNREEATAAVSGLQTADPDAIAGLLENPLLQGKDDEGLTRLGQYKLLEKRKGDALAGGGSNVDFLRSSNIRVYIEPDVETHVDRAIELINRTNQLNFTKIRLPDDPAAARAELLGSIRRYTNRCGLIKVVDNYGDYGFCGFFLLLSYPRPKLRHFCFSCRTIGMGLESYIYQKLGRPELATVGVTLSDPKTDPEVDWIQIVDCDISGSKARDRIVKHFSFHMRGGCDASNLGHYAGLVADDVVGEYNYVRDGIDFRIDHSLIGRHCLTEMPPETFAAFSALGYVEQDFQSRVLRAPADSVCLLSFGADCWSNVYRRRGGSALVPFHPAGILDVTNGPARRVLEILENDYELVGTISPAMFRGNLELIFASLARRQAVYVLLQARKDAPAWQKRAVEMDRCILEAAAGFPNVHTLRIDDFVRGEDETFDEHPTRIVYFRLFDHIRARVPAQIQS